MKFTKMVQAAGTALLLLLALSASALANPLLGIQLSEAGFATLQQTSSTSPLILNGAYGTFTGNVETNTFTSNPTSLDLASSNISSTTAGTLTIIASVNGVTGPTGGLVDFFSQFSGSFVGSGVTITERAFLDASNTLFGTGTALSPLFNETTSPFATSSHLLMAATEPYALTEVLTISTTGAVNIFSLDAQLSAACVPGAPGCVQNPPTEVAEPTSMALMGTALIGFGIFFGWVRRRNQGGRPA